MPRKLTPEEVAALGLDAPDSSGAPRQPRKLTPEEVAALGLDAPGALPVDETPAKKTSIPQALMKGVQNATGTGDLVGSYLQGALYEGKVLGDMLFGDRRLPRSVDEFLETGREIKDFQEKAFRENRQETKKAFSDRPGYTILGGMAAAPLLPVVPAAGAAVGLGAGVGAVSGAASSDEKGLGRLKDAATGAVGGGLAGGVGHGLAKALPMALRTARTKLEQFATNAGRRVLQGGSDLASAARAPVSDDAVREALRSGAIRTFGTTTGAAKRLGRLTEEQGQVYGAIIDELEKRGVTGPNARRLADSLLAQADALEPNTMNKALPQAFRDTADDVVEKSMLAEARGIAPTGRLGLTQAENLKRSLQEAARYGRFEETPLNEARRQIASTVRQANEDAVQRAAEGLPIGNEVRELADAFVPVKQRLGRLIEASAAADKGASKAAQRNAMGLPEKMALFSAAATGNIPAVASAGIGTRMLQGALNRGGSTAAQAAFQGSRLSRALAQLAAAHPRKVLRGGQLAALPALTEEEMKRQAILEYLRGGDQ